MKKFILPFRDLVVSPGLTVPVLIDNPTSVSCIKTAAKEGHQQLILTPQHTWAYPTTPGDIYDVGTIGDVVQILSMPDGAVHALIKTTDVVKLTDIEVTDGVFTANIDAIKIEDSADDKQVLILRDIVAENMYTLSNMTRKFKPEKVRNVVETYPLPAFVDFVVQTADIDTEIAVKGLRATSWQEKLTILLEEVKMLIETIKIDETIARRINQQMDSGRREAILHEKLRAIQKEIGDEYDDELDSANIKQKIESTDIPTEVREKALAEWKRMRAMPPMSHEGGLLKTYLDELMSMPWGKPRNNAVDLNKARKILDSEHSGMIPVKERILEHIAVMKKTNTNRGSILCFVGAPGVGKTSLCKSIADSLGRKYQRISLGGVSDESHFRGHRKTYIGAQIGRIMDALKRSKECNPVIVLDEIDKMGRDWRGDPEAALLEILDPEQNKHFRDHYLEVDFDLSNVLFIATANSLNMSNALKDRMEIIEIPGYSIDEKVKIAQEHLIKRAAQDTGWKQENIIMSDDAIKHLIQKYTSEQGVRQLKREITAVLRRSLLENNCEDVKTEFTPEKIDQLLASRHSVAFSKKIGFGARI